MKTSLLVEVYIRLQSNLTHENVIQKQTAAFNTPDKYKMQGTVEWSELPVDFTS